MDLLHSGRFDGFCLVSSDSDFTRLAARIREQGIDVYGIGQQKTPEGFRQACTRFIFTENFVARGRSPAPARRALRPIAEAVELIGKALEQMEDDAEGWFHLGTVGQRLQNLSPEFDTRTYGHAKLSDLVVASGRYEIDRDRGSSACARSPSAAEAGEPAPPPLGRARGGFARARGACSSATGLPAALLLGPMLAGIGFSARRGGPRGAGARLPPRAGAGRADDRPHPGAAGAARRSLADWPVFAARRRRR